MQMFNYQRVELDHSFFLDFSLNGPWPLSSHDPDGIPGGDVVVVDQVAGAHHTGSTATLGTVNTNTLESIKTV